MKPTIDGFEAWKKNKEKRIRRKARLEKEVVRFAMRACAGRIFHKDAALDELRFACNELFQERKKRG